MDFNKFFQEIHRQRFTSQPGHDSLKQTEGHLFQGLPDHGPLLCMAQLLLQNGQHLDVYNAVS